MSTRVHWLLLAICYGRYALKAFIQLKMDWDYLVYHLPFSLRHFGLTKFRTYPRIEAVYDALPPLPHLVSGALVWMTGRISASSGLNILALCVLVGSFKWLNPAASVRWLLTALLAVPIVVVHLPSGYIDFWTGVFAAMVLLGGMALERGLTVRACIVTLVGVLGAMLSKYQAWPFVALIGVALAARLMWRARSTGAWRQTVLLLVLLAAAAAAFPARNLWLYGNPTYPFEPPLIGKLLNVPMEASEFSHQRPAEMAGLSSPQIFVHSLLETTRWNAPGFGYSVDQGFNDGPASPHFRMGGWGLPVVIGWIVFGFFCISARSPLRHAVVVLGVFLVFAAVIRQGYELRYWMVVPLSFAALWGIAAASGEGRRWQWAKAYCVLVAIWSVAQTHQMLDLRNKGPIDYAPEGAKLYWNGPKSPDVEGTEPVCKKDKYSIFYAGPTFNEFPVRACD